MPRFPAEASVLVKTMNVSEFVPQVIHILAPFITQSFPFLTAFVFILPQSEPEFGSVKPKQPNFWPLARGVNHSFSAPLSQLSSKVHAG